MGEYIKTFWRLGYFKLFDDQGYRADNKDVSLVDSEWRRLFWRFYWRVSR